MGLCVVMLTPLVISILESLKTTQEAAAVPPTYYPHILSLDGYRRLWNVQAGLPVYLFNSTGAALLTIIFCLALTIPAGYALARFPIAGKEGFFVFLLLSLIIPYQALVNPIFFMFEIGRGTFSKSRKLTFELTVSTAIVLSATPFGLLGHPGLAVLQ